MSIEDKSMDKILEENRKMEERIWDLLSGLPTNQKAMILSTMTVIIALRIKMYREELCNLMRDLYDTPSSSKIIN